jgi:hypothetical protein
MVKVTIFSSFAIPNPLFIWFFHHRGTESTEDIKGKAEKINKFSEAPAKVTSSVIPAKARRVESPTGIQNGLNPAPSGTGFRVALRLPGMTTSTGFQELYKGLFKL